jgi:Bacterial type II and III secretion system protein
MVMTRHMAAISTTLFLTFGFLGAPAVADHPESRDQQAAKVAAIPIKVDITLTRLQGEKKVSSLPYTLWMNAGGDNVSMRMGVDIPVGSTLVTSGNENAAGNRTTTVSSTTNRVEFRNVGISIDCAVNPTADGRFSVNLRIQDSSIFTSDADTRAPLKLADPMAFRTFSFSNQLTMRDGQTMQWASAPDKFSGEVLRMDAVLTVLK